MTKSKTKKYNDLYNREYPSIIRENVKIQFVYIGEGNDGDFDEDDIDDYPHLRIDVLVLENGEWIMPQDASNCVGLSAFTSDRKLKKILHELMDCYFESFSERNIKHPLENVTL